MEIRSKPLITAAMLAIATMNSRVVHTNCRAPCLNGMRRSSADPMRLAEESRLSLVKGAEELPDDL